MAQNQTSIGCIGSLDRHRRLSKCYLPVPKQFGGGLGRLSSVAQSATAGPGRTRVMICCLVAASGRCSSFSCHYELSAAAVDRKQIGNELPGNCEVARLAWPFCFSMS